MKRTKVKLLTAMLLFAAFLFVQDANAQSVFANEVSQLSAKSGVNPDNFYQTDNAADILKAEIEALQNAAGNLNGGSAEANNSLRTNFYLTIFENLNEVDNTMEAIHVSVPSLESAAGNMNVPVNTQGIINDAIALLTL